MVVEKKKPCPVCTYLKVYSPEFIIEVNNLIFSKGKEKQVLDLLVTSKILNNMVKPTGHFIEKHRKNCLIGFIAKVDDNKIIPEDKNCLVNTSLQSFLDEYEKMTIQERDNEHIQRLKKIKYLSGVVILQELLSGKHLKSIPKEDISALKQVEDIIQNIKIPEDKDRKINFFISVKENENLVRLEENEKGFTEEEKNKSLEESKNRVIEGKDDPRWKRMWSNK